MYKTLAHIGGLIVVVGLACYGFFLDGRYILGSVVVGELDKVRVLDPECHNGWIFASKPTNPDLLSLYERKVRCQEAEQAIAPSITQIKSSWGF